VRDPQCRRRRAAFTDPSPRCSARTFGKRTAGRCDRSAFIANDPIEALRSEGGAQPPALPQHLDALGELWTLSGAVGPATRS
jgi:hypothetical protein